jgi:hypothetical protein
LLAQGKKVRAVRSRREPVSHAEIYIEFAELEIRDGEQRMLLLLQRQETSDLPEVTLIFESEEEILTELARQPGRWREIRLPVLPKVRSTIGLTMNSQSALRTPRIGRTSTANLLCENFGVV